MDELEISVFDNYLKDIEKCGNSLYQVLLNSGYDVIENVNDARWFLSKKEEFETLCHHAEQCDKNYTKNVMDELEKAHQDYIERKKKIIFDLELLRSDTGDKQYEDKLTEAIEFLKEKEI